MESVELRRKKARERARAKRDQDPNLREKERQASKARYYRIRQDPLALASLRADERRRYADRKQDPQFVAKEYVRAQRRRFEKYGITEDDYFQMAVAQDYRCAVCRCQAKLFIDHCHTSGRVRGLLCHHCNTALGHLKEDIQIMQALINYTAKS